MKKCNPKLEGLADILRAGLIALALFMDMELRSWDNYSNWFASFQPYTLGVSAAAAVAFIALRWGRKHLSAPSRGMRIAALFLGAWQVAAVSVANTGDVNQPFLTSGQMMKTVVLALGMACLFTLLFRLLEAGLDGRLDIGAAGDSRLLRLYRSHTLAFCAAVVLLCWLPRLAISYPCGMNSDAIDQTRQVMGLVPLNNHHPILGTLLIGAAISLGRMFSSVNAGLFLYILIQALFGVMVIGYSQKIMRRLCVSRWLRALALGVCALAPVYSCNISVIIKDVPYTYATLLFLCELARGWLMEEEGYVRCAGCVVRIALAGFILMRFRNNGVFILVPTALFAVMRARKSGGRVPPVRTALVMLIPFVLSAAFGMGTDKLMEVQPAKVQEALSLPMQQTARFVKEHGDEIPQDERDAIAGVLDYENLARLYDPMISDPVKATWCADADKEAIVRYMGVWMRQFLRDPVCYVKATFIQNALLFDPQTFNLALFTGDDLTDELKQLLNAGMPENIERLSEKEDHLRTFFFSLPTVVQLNTVGFYAIILVGTCMISIKRRAKGMDMILTPQIMTIAVMIAGPCIQNQDRYGFPIVYLMPLALGCLSYALKKKNDSQE